MNSPKVSILIPVYNTAQYLPRCLDSALAQSLKEIEVIAVNDASPDNSAAILADYAAKDSRIRIVTHEKNGGILAARVSGIRAANAPYVTFLDADDLLAECAMELAVGKAEKTGADIVHFATRVFDESGTAKPEHLKLAEKKLLPHRAPILEKDIFDQAFIKQSYRWTLWAKLYRTDLCRNAADILPDGYYLMAKDICFYTLISFYAHRYESLDYPGYLYYLNAGVSAYQPIDLAGFRRRCSIFTACRTVRWFLESRGVFEKYQDAFRKQEDQMLGDLVHRWLVTDRLLRRAAAVIVPDACYRLWTTMSRTPGNISFRPRPTVRPSFRSSGNWISSSASPFRKNPGKKLQNGWRSAIIN